MARRSIFNDPSPVNTSDEEAPEHQPSDFSVTEPESDPETLPPSDEDPYKPETLQLSNEDPQSNPKDQDGHSSPPSSPVSSESDRRKPHRWGDHEDTRLTVKDYYGVLASLDRDHGTSLSNHLYSAHLIKKRNRITRSSDSDSDYNSSSDSDSSIITKKQRREYSPSALAGDTLVSRSKRFITNSWTSWPHPPSYVPRENEHKTGSLRSQPRKSYFDDDTYDKKSQTKGDDAPSQMLEEMLTATFLRLSKEKLRSRPEKERRGLVPVLDDDVSAHTLRPVVRNVISKLDGLLKGLYHERRYVKALVEEDEAVEREVVEQEAMKGRKLSQYKQTQARKKAQAAARKRGVTPMTDTEDDESAEDEEEESQPNKKYVPRTKSSKGRRRKPAPPKLAKKYATKRKNRLRPRDWSQVLGIASLTGWEGDTLQKTVKRCEGQFEQTMGWRRLKHDDHIKEQKSGEMWTGARLKQPMVSSSGSDEEEEGISRDGFMMPIKGVGRKKRVKLKMSQRKRRKLKARSGNDGVK